MNTVTEQRKVLLEIADLKVHFDCMRAKPWAWSVNQAAGNRPLPVRLSAW